MYRPMMRFVALAAALAMAAGLGADAHAGWGHHGSHGSYGSVGGSYGGGSYGGGSYGGASFGSHGSHGGWASHGSHGSQGGFFHRLFHHRHYRVAYNSCGSHGGWASHGSYGSYGGASYGSAGAYYGGGYGGGGYGGGGYGAGRYGGGGMYVDPAQEGPYFDDPAQDQEGPIDGTQEVPGDSLPVPDEDSISAPSAYLTVTLPSDATVFVNGQATSSTGSYRQYVSRNLAPGKKYRYEIRALVNRDGEVIEETKRVDLRAGETQQLAFDLNQARQIETSLTLQVPTDAEVYLGGNKTATGGDVRVFRTTALKSGDQWKDYEIEVRVKRSDEMLTKKQVVTLTAGDTRQLTFDFDTAQVADAR